MRLKDHLNKLEYFCAVVEAGSLKSASEVVYVGQPQLTKVIKQLEDVCGKKLFVRSPKGVVLTKSGDQLYAYAKEVIQKASEAEYLIKAGEFQMDATIKIGTYDSIARYFFPDFLKYLKATVPGIKVFLETGKSTDIYKKLSQNNLDIAVIVSQEKTQKGVEGVSIYQDSFGLYQAPNLAADFKEQLIFFPFPANETKKAMKKFGFNESIQCDNLETVRSMTEQGIGVGLLPHKVAKESVLSSKLTAFHHPGIPVNSFDFHDISIYHLEKQVQSEKTFILGEIQRFLQIWSKN